jgi:hypothetical protein
VQIDHMWPICAKGTRLGRTIQRMKLLLTFAAFCAFMKWRHERLDADDARYGYGAHAPLKPEA